MNLNIQPVKLKHGFNNLKILKLGVVFGEVRAIKNPAEAG